MSLKSLKNPIIQNLRRIDEQNYNLYKYFNYESKTREALKKQINFFNSL